MRRLDSMETGIVQLGFALKPDKHRQLKVKVAGQGRTMKSVVAELVDLYLEDKVSVASYDELGDPLP